MQFEPNGHLEEPVLCWTIPIGAEGQTVENVYACDSQEPLLDANERAEAIPFDFKKPIGMREGLGSAPEG